MTPSKPTVEVLYNCAGCGIKDRAVTVEERGACEPLHTWILGKMAEAISRDHDKYSPICHVTKFPQVKVPVNSLNQAGRANRH